MELGKLLLFSFIAATFWLLASSGSRNNQRSQDNKEIIHSRQKRFVSFPEGSSFSVSICMTIGVIGNPNVNWLSFGLNWGVSYELPNETWAIKYVYGIKNYIHDESSALTRRRDRRTLYSEMETIMNSMGYDGKNCIFRALCESQKLLDQQSGTMEEQLVKSIFSLPFLKFKSPEHRSIGEYDRAYRINDESIECSTLYPECRFSLLALAFGKHSRPDLFMK